MNISTRTWIIIGAAAVVVAVLVFAVFATIFGWWGIVVDITLTVAALISAALLGFLTYAVFTLIRTVLKIRDEVMPTLDSLRETSATVRETARAASVFGVQPTVRTASSVLGASEVASVIFGRGHTATRAEQRQRRRQEIEREQGASDARAAARSDRNGHR